MMLLLDTNIVSKIIRGRERQVRQRYREAIDAGVSRSISAIVLHELHYGALRASAPIQNLERIAVFVAALDSVEAFTAKDAEVAGEIRAVLAREGQMIGPFDLLIAAQALRLDATLVTGSVGEFSRIAGLKWIDWTIG